MNTEPASPSAAGIGEPENAVWQRMIDHSHTTRSQWQAAVDRHAATGYLGRAHPERYLPLTDLETALRVVHTRWQRRGS